MWLLLDIGNSAVKGGFASNGDILAPFRLALPPDAPPDAWNDAFRSHLVNRHVSRIGIASVVPALTQRVGETLAAFMDIEPQILHVEMRMPFAMAYETPQTLGIDRLAAAAAAWSRYGADASPARSVIAIDAGTAVTYEVVDQQGGFRGGLIGAGPELVRDALAEGTAQLPKVDLELPSHPIGRSTRAALQGGILFGFLDSVRGMVARISAEIDAEPVVIASGGWGAWLHEHSEVVHHYDPNLVLHGVEILMALNPASP